VNTGSPRYSSTGLFLAFEGGDGVGKSTQAHALVEWLRARGCDVVQTSEPGGSDVGKQIRAIVLDPATGEIDDRAETLLYAADKAEHVSKVIRPALDRRAVVVTDRYVDSTLAYQGAGRSLGVESVETVARWATGDLRPHLTVLLDAAPEHALERLAGTDRLEAEPVAFHDRVRAGFLALAAADPDHYLVLDAHGTRADITTAVTARVDALLATADVDRSDVAAPDTARHGGAPGT
jgi:dTMP kinase